MAADVTAHHRVTGVEELKRNFKLAERDVLNLSRSATHKVAAQVTKLARRYAPKDTGALRKAIKTKRRRAVRGHAKSDVIIVPGTSRKTKDGAWYWHFPEFGTRKLAAKPYIRPAVDQVKGDAPRVYREDLNNRAVRLMQKRAKAAQK